jgi:TetR/AcrR family transcriptional repressor of nem operon
VGRPRGYDRERALAAATEAFWSSGYSATSMRALMAATAMAPTSLYAEFGGKEALFTLAIARYVEDVEERYAAMLGGEERGLEPLRRHFESYRFDTAARGCLLVNSLGERGEIPNDAARLIDTFFEGVGARYAVHLRAARDRGEIPSRVDPEALAEALLALDQGLAVAATLPGRRGRATDGVRAFFDALRAEEDL